MFRLVSNKKLKRIWQKGYDQGISRGYELGYKLGQVEANNKGFILGGYPNKVEREREQILKEKEWR